METKNIQLSRRTLIGRAALGAAALTGAGVLTTRNSFSTGDNDEDAGKYFVNVLNPKAAIDYKTAANFSIVPDSVTKVGAVAENLLSAITGETGAAAKYEAFSAVAKQAGYAQIARLFQATADAEKIHINFEFTELQKINPAAAKPEPPAVQAYKTDVNLILGANGEIYETSDMYPAFIKAAIASGDDSAAFIFARAKLAEAYHAERYMEAYNNIDTPDGDTYYLCPVCGYIHKGENIKACPICLMPKSSFKAY